MSHLKLWRIVAYYLLIAACSKVFACEIRTDTAPVAEGSIAFSSAGPAAIQSPRILLLHGLFAQKEQWQAVLCGLVDQGYQVTAPDLPGYGQSLGFDISAYQLERQAELLHAFAQQRQLTPLHIAGNSMGGAIAAIYTQQYPTEIISLTFVGGTLGLGGWAPPVKAALFKGFNPFIPINTTQFDDELSLLLATPPMLSEPEKQAAIAPYLTDNRHYQQVWDIVNLYGNVLLNRPRQATPTLIIWGAEDHVFDISRMPVLARGYVRPKTVVLKEAGHLAMLDAPSEVVRQYQAFLNDLPSPSSNRRQFTGR